MTLSSCFFFILCIITTLCDTASAFRVPTSNILIPGPRITDPTTPLGMSAPTYTTDCLDPTTPLGMFYEGAGTRTRDISQFRPTTPLGMFNYNMGLLGLASHLANLFREGMKLSTMGNTHMGTAPIWSSTVVFNGQHTYYLYRRYGNRVLCYNDWRNIHLPPDKPKSDVELTYKHAYFEPTNCHCHVGDFHQSWAH